nr:MAG: hypothetical protein [uncultured cyanophage]
MVRKSYFLPHLDRYLLKATLYVEVASDSLTTDNLGNIVPSSHKQPFICYLKETGSKGDLKQQRPGGMGLSQSYMKGYLVEPMVFPDSVVLPCEFDAEIDGKKGKFSANIHNQQPWEKGYTGTKIKGWWIDN